MRSTSGVKAGIFLTREVEIYLWYVLDKPISEGDLTEIGKMIHRNSLMGLDVVGEGQNCMVFKYGKYTVREFYEPINRYKDYFPLWLVTNSSPLFTNVYAFSVCGKYAVSEYVDGFTLQRGIHFLSHDLLVEGVSSVVTTIMDFLGTTGIYYADLHTGNVVVSTTGLRVIDMDILRIGRSVVLASRDMEDFISDCVNEYISRSGEKDDCPSADVLKGRILGLVNLDTYKGLWA